MPSKKKKFIDKKHAVTFTLVHRSQRDPEAANEDAPQRVLLERQKEEQINYGIQFDDEYNYMQHLKDVKELYDVQAETFRIGRPSAEVILDPLVDKPSLILPSNVFASNNETTVGLLNKAAPIYGPQPDLDPDIIAALDGEMNSDEEMEDDFFAKANEDPISKEQESNDASDDLDSDNCQFSTDNESVDNDGLQKKRSILKKKSDYNDNDDLVSHFTGCSMTSSVIRRNPNLQMIDEKFEKFYKKFKKEENGNNSDDSYDSIEDEDFVDLDVFNHLVGQFTHQSKNKIITMKDFVEKHLDAFDKSKNQNTDDLLFDTDESEEFENIVVEKPNKDWDCESYLSNYSNTSNLPKTINISNIEIKNHKKIPKKPEKSPSQQSDFTEKECTESKSHKPLIILRDENETTEEKKIRKRAIKEDKKLRRLEKSRVKELFKEEKLKLKKQIIDNRQNLQGTALLM